MLGTIELPLELFLMANNEDEFDEEKLGNGRRNEANKWRRKLLCNDLTEGANALWAEKTHYLL